MWNYTYLISCNFLCSFVFFLTYWWVTPHKIKDRKKTFLLQDYGDNESVVMCHVLFSEHLEFPVVPLLILWLLVCSWGTRFQRVIMVQRNTGFSVSPHFLHLMDGIAGKDLKWSKRSISVRLPPLCWFAIRLLWQLFAESYLCLFYMDHSRMINTSWK